MRESRQARGPDAPGDPGARVPNILKLHDVAPRVAAAVAELYRSLAATVELTALEREAIAVAVSAANRCEYCLHHHGAALEAQGVPQSALRERGESSGQVPARLRAIVAFAEKLTRRPWSMSPQDSSALRAHGLTDVGVHEVAVVAAAFNFSNRVALGLGVPIEREG